MLAHRLDGPADAPVVVLGGSLGTTSAVWEPQLAALAGFRVLRYDHAGHGASPLPERASVEAFARDVVALLDALGVERAAVCGLSLGGAVAMRLAVDAPERVDRLVLASAAARFPNAHAYGERARLVRQDGLEAIADAVVGRWFTGSFRDSHLEIVRRYRAMLVSTPAEGYARGCEAIRDFDVRDALGRVAAPTLVVAGADDPVTTPHTCGLLADAIPDAELVVLDGAAHLCNVEQADRFSRAVLAHLTS